MGYGALVAFHDRNSICCYEIQKQKSRFASDTSIGTSTLNYEVIHYIMTVHIFYVYVDGTRYRSWEEGRRLFGNSRSAESTVMGSAIEARRPRHAYTR